ncbi:pyridoxamine 5'-phosphate oxidase family protein [Fredinandcohnia sp. 179-A 10B2 NHS]|uniref:pyridoxamine 5'-phosphate oxidase family protein n=1 Tax=Fredinandcohnia sp. 179-A 10B2 NHS TaxID=3235176 RepID=UPI0039A0288A
MANRVELSLVQPLFESLQKERFVTIASIDFETSGPNVTAISWVYAPSEGVITFAIDTRSRIVQNIQHNPLVVMTMFANESTYAISGNARVKKEKLENVPLQLTLIEVTINEVRDVMFYGSKISIEPKYEKTYDEAAAAKLDNQVMEAMRNA